MGHDVRLFAFADSQTTAKLEPSWPEALRLSACRDSLAPHIPKSLQSVGDVVVAALPVIELRLK
jgi:hypothetical protein